MRGQQLQEAGHFRKFSNGIMLLLLLLLQLLLWLLLLVLLTGLSCIQRSCIPTCC
jgi:hypothetical protein